MNKDIIKETVGCKEPIYPSVKEGAKYPEDWVICGFTRVGNDIQYCSECAVLKYKQATSKKLDAFESSLLDSDLLTKGVDDRLTILKQTFGSDILE